jgi:two-component system, response regulator YesN
MTNMLIVDDETEIAQGLQSTIKWKLIGIQNVYIARSGEEALSKLENELIGIVVTDIKMPGISGLDLAKIIWQKYSDIKVIILSGYSEFAFAKTAMQYGVKNYLTKPISIKDLIKEVNDCRKEIEKIKENKNDYNEIVTDSLKKQKIMFLQRLMLEKNNNRSKIIKELKKFDLGKENETFFLISYIVDADNNYCRIELLLKQKMTNMLDSLKIRYYCLDDVEGRTFFFINMQESQSILMDKLSDIVESIEQKCRVKLSFLLSAPFYKCSCLNNAYKELCSLKTISFFEKYESVVIYRADRNSNNENKIIKIDEKFKKTFKNSGSINYGIIKGIFDEISGLEIDDVDCIKDIGTDILNMILQCYPDKKTYPVAYKMYLSAHNEIKDCRRYSKLCNIVFKYEQELQNLRESTQNDKQNKIVVQIKNFVESNYNHSFNIDELSTEINRSPNYVSHIFSEANGETIIEYLNRIRIKESQKILMYTDFTIYTIAKDVGYNNEKYFIKMFKKYTGQTPTAFRNTHKINKLS